MQALGDEYLHFFISSNEADALLWKHSLEDRKYLQDQIRQVFIVFSSFGGGVAMRQRLLLRLLLLGQRLLQTHAFPGVVLPVQQLLLIDEFGTLGVDQLFPEVLVLQQLQHVQTVGVPVEEHHPSQTGVHSGRIHWLSSVCL